MLPTNWGHAGTTMRYDRAHVISTATQATSSAAPPRQRRLLKEGWLRDG
jgi:hypothetical protein